MRHLEQVLADWREDAAVLHRQGQRIQAETIQRFAQDVEEAAHEYITWLDEDDAMLRSAHSQRWLRSRFPEWERAGHAKYERGRRWYRMLVVPGRANLSRAYDSGRLAAEQERVA